MSTILSLQPDLVDIEKKLASADVHHSEFVIGKPSNSLVHFSKSFRKVEDQMFDVMSEPVLENQLSTKLNRTAHQINIVIPVRIKIEETSNEGQL